MANKVLTTSKFVFFWGGWPSQWSKSPFEIDGIPYNCGEQFMMAEKARVFNDPSNEAQILVTTNPGTQKALGRAVVGFDADLWNSICRGIVFRGNLARFEQNETLRDHLLATGNRTLVEASPKDRIWGIGLHQDDPRAQVPEEWRGRNWLGIALMQVRDELKRRTGQIDTPMDEELQLQLDRRMNRTLRNETH